MLGVILPGWDASASASKSASRGFGGHAEGRHLILWFEEEGVHGRLRTKGNRSRATTSGYALQISNVNEFPSHGSGASGTPSACRAQR